MSKPYTTIEEVAEHSIPAFMSGIMSRDWPKAMRALYKTAETYHQVNGFLLHPDVNKAADIPPEACILVSAAMWAFKIQGTSAEN